MDSAYFQKLATHRLLTAREEQELGRRIQAGGEDGLRAKQTLMEFNTRLVLAAAKRWVNRGVEFEDLVQSGMLGLGRACELYDPDKGYKFSTYATAWINQPMQRAVDASDPVRLPGTIKRVRLHAANHPDATPDEIAAACKCSVRQVRWALTAASVSGSLDARTGRGEHAVEVYETVADESPELDELAEEGVFDETPPWLREGLDSLPAEQREVIEAQYGLNGYAHERTLLEVALLLDRPEHEVRKLSAVALATLREAAEC